MHTHSSYRSSRDGATGQRPNTHTHASVCARTHAYNSPHNPVCIQSPPYPLPCRRPLPCSAPPLSPLAAHFLLVMISYPNKGSWHAYLFRGRWGDNPHATSGDVAEAAVESVEAPPVREKHAERYLVPTALLRRRGKSERGGGGGGGSY